MISLPELMRFKPFCTMLLTWFIIVPVSGKLILNDSLAAPKNEFRSFWLSTEAGQDWPPESSSADVQRDALKEIIRNASEMGFNAVMFQVVPQGDAYYLSERLPRSVYLAYSAHTQTQNGSWDPLAFAVEESHKLGMELHAWYNVYLAGRGECERSPDIDPPHVFFAHPEWLEHIGNPDGSSMSWINPALPDARAWIIGNVLEIVENYDVDAIHFDAIRYTVDYDRDENLMQDHNPAGHDNIDDWRRENINLFVRDVHTAVKAAKPWVKVGSASAGHYMKSGGWAANFGYSGYYQDSRRWIEEEVHDYLSPQLFLSLGTAFGQSTTVHNDSGSFGLSAANFTEAGSGDLPKSGHTLNLPPRSANALTGEQLIQKIDPLSPSDREEILLGEIAGGNIPSYMRSLVPVTVAGGDNTITFYVTADYMSIGSDADAFITPMTPLLGQKTADFLDCMLPTRKMVDLIWDAAPLKLAPRPIPPSDQMTTVPVFAEHNDMLKEQRQPTLDDHPPGTLVAGTKKDVIISNRYTQYSTPRVIIYGWHQLNGSPIQPVSGVHGENYVDYSHGIRLVSRDILLNGEPARLENVLQDERYASLLSDEGVQDVLRYPVPLPRFGWLLDDWISGTQGRHIYPGTGPFRLDIRNELPAQIDAIRGAQAPGHVHYSYTSIADHPFDDRYSTLSIVPPMPWLSMRSPGPVKNLNAAIDGRQVDLIWEEPDPGRGETDPFFRYVIYRIMESRVVTDQTVIDDPVHIIGITGERSFSDVPKMENEVEDVVYYVTALSRNNVEGDFQKATVEVVTAGQDASMPGEIRLESNYPNPFNPTTEIRFQIPSGHRVNLRVYDLLGREVATLVNEYLPAGSHSATFQAAELSSGIFIYRLQSAGSTLNRKMTLIK